MKTQRTTLLILFLILVINSKGQVYEQNIELQVLQKSIIDKQFVFGKWTENGETETHLKYLGQLKTKSGKTIKIINSIFIWGLSQRATSRILIFNGGNQYVGNYYLKTDELLPSRLQNGKLIFNNTGSDCNKKLRTIINLKNGLPKQFFRKCNDKYGDSYRFESN